MLVVDDALLLALLAETVTEDLQIAVNNSELFSTGSWYWRLSRALHDRASTGVLSRALDDLTPTQHARAIASVDRLPHEVGLLGLRELVPVMTALDTSRRLNLLTAEAVAVAVVLDATIVVTTESALLTETCTRIGIDLRRIAR